MTDSAGPDTKSPMSLTRLGLPIGVWLGSVAMFLYRVGPAFFSAEPLFQENCPKYYYIADLTARFLAETGAYWGYDPTFAAGLLLKAEVRLADGQVRVLSSNEAWRTMGTEEANWQQLAFEDGTWSPVRVIGKYGTGSWNEVTVPAVARPAGNLAGAVKQKAAQVVRQAVKKNQPVVERTPSDGFIWPEAAT